MSLYIVVHHLYDSSQPWVNSWKDRNRLEAITTTTEIGQLCSAAKQRNERIFVHRCAHGDHSATICCSVEVSLVAELDKRTALVKFINPQVYQFDVDPPQHPPRGTNSYVAKAFVS